MQVLSYILPVKTIPGPTHQEPTCSRCQQRPGSWSSHLYLACMDTGRTRSIPGCSGKIWTIIECQDCQLHKVQDLQAGGSTQENFSPGPPHTPPQRPPPLLPSAPRLRLPRVPTPMYLLDLQM